MSGSAMERRLRKMETADDRRDAGYWFTEHLRALNGDQEAGSSIDAIRAAGGSPGYRGFQAMISDVTTRLGELAGSGHVAELTEADYVQMGAA